MDRSKIKIIKAKDVAPAPEIEARPETEREVIQSLTEMEKVRRWMMASRSEIAKQREIEAAMFNGPETDTGL